MNASTVTADTLTPDQCERLIQEAAEAGDDAMVRLARSAYRQTNGGERDNESAIDACVDAINAAADMAAEVQS
jgi:hypothetical protein